MKSSPSAAFTTSFHLSAINLTASLALFAPNHSFFFSFLDPDSSLTESTTALRSMTPPSSVELASPLVTNAPCPPSSPPHGGNRCCTTFFPRAVARLPLAPRIISITIYLLPSCPLLALLPRSVLVTCHSFESNRSVSAVSFASFLVNPHNLGLTAEVNSDQR
ncbi:NAD-dependent dehydratase [Sesbania bispinosa]|nr:NAD-dependent dehydratase [Sesbania bispinosa]